MPGTLDHARTPIKRHLEDGWDYQPDWRLCLIDAYLDDISKAKDQRDALQTIIFRERDPFVRQGLRFRMTGKSAAHSAFAWAFHSAATNAGTGLLSMIKAMIVASIPARLIAIEFGTVPANIVVIEKLFFDVRRFGQNRIWMRSAVIAPHLEALPTPEQARERTWLTAGFEGGATRLLSMLGGKEDLGSERLESTAQEIEAVTGRRALEYVRRLDREGAVTGEDDLKRYLLARGMRSREAATTASDQAKKLGEWHQSLLLCMDERHKSEIDAKTFANASRLLPIAEIARRQIEHNKAMAALDTADELTDTACTGNISSPPDSTDSGSAAACAPVSTPVVAAESVAPSH